MKISSPQSGNVLLSVVILTGVVSILGFAATRLVMQSIKFASVDNQRELAFQIAEAGISYYRWHLAHNPNDYQDGTGGPGPYVHSYTDADGNQIGEFSLTITPPPTGSTIATITSAGYTTANPTLRRTITSQMGIPSFSNFAVLSDDFLRFGAGTETFGPIHSNKGIRFDGLAHGLITSSATDYDDPDHSGCNEFGVHTHDSPVDPCPPAAVPTRSDVFAGGRQFPVAPVNFNGVTADLNNMQASAIASGIRLLASGGQGYHLVFNTNDTVDIYRVDTLNRCRWRNGGSWVDYADVWSVSTETLLFNDRALPANGIIFIEDDVWVNGTINTARVTVVAAREPLASGQATIIINNDLRYANGGGQETMGLIAQKDISVGFYSEDNLQIDAAMIAQKGRIGRYYYAPHSTGNPANCTDYVYRDTITVNGSLATALRYGFAYTDGTGYETRNLNFDTNLIFGPPPSFPTTGQYQVLSWDEQ